MRFTHPFFSFLKLFLHFPFFGIPHSSRQVDVKHNVQVAIAKTNEARFNYMTQSGIHGSYLEGSVLDQLFGRQLQPAISATQILMEAGHQNIPIYTITAENVNTILPILNVSAEVKSDIIHAVNSGQQAIVPEREIQHGNWKGSGYILQDLLTGGGAYLLEGGYNGGGHGICFTSRKPPAMGISALSSAAAQQKMAEAFNLFFSTWASILAKIVFSDFEYPSDEAKKGVMTAARNLATMVNQLVDETLGTSHGCLMIFANDINKEEIYVPFERDEQSGVYKDSVTVNFTNEVPDICVDPVWDFGGGDTTTEPNPTRAYSETGKREVTLKANCKATGGSSQPEQVTAAVYVSKVDMDVREHYYPINQVPPNDPRLVDLGRDDWLARNKLLVWHNSDNEGKITFDVVKLDANSVFWVEIIGTGIKHPELPIFNKLTASFKDYNLYIVEDNDDSDVLVKYGLDFDQSGSLEKQNRQGHNEVFGEYEVYGISGEEYAESQNNFNHFYLWTVSHLGNALVYRVANGVFEEPNLFSRKDYRPYHVKNNQSPTRVTKNAYEELTHRCGTQFTNKPDINFVTIPRTRKNGTIITKDGRTLITYRLDPNGRKYPDAEANINVYYYDSSSDAATLIREYEEFQEKIEKIIIGKRLSYDDIKNQYVVTNGGRQKLTFPVKSFFVDFKPYGKIGLGGVSINAPQNVIHLWVEMQGLDFVINQAQVSLRIEDMFDYNYFKPGIPNWTDASRSATMIQCGFGKSGAVANAGELGLVRIDVDGLVEIGTVIKSQPTPSP